MTNVMECCIVITMGLIFFAFKMYDNTTQHNTTQHNTTQHNTTQLESVF